MESTEQQRSNLLSAVTVNFIKAKQAIRMSGTLPSDTSPESYHNNADPEMDSAKRLADSLEPWRYSVPPGPILEVGAGTGILTNHIRRILPKREISVTDASPIMLEKARAVYGESNGEQLRFSQFDPEKDNIREQHYSLICGNHVAHQFQNPASALEKLALGLTLDGLMLMSFPGEDSFQEWRSTCVDLGIPYTGKAMPGTEPLVIHLSMGPVQVDFYEDQSTWYFDSFESFRRHMASGGLEIEDAERRLKEKEIELLNKNWTKTKEGKIGFTYHNVSLAVKRIGE